MEHLKAEQKEEDRVAVGVTQKPNDDSAPTHIQKVPSDQANINFYPLYHRLWKTLRC